MKYIFSRFTLLSVTLLLFSGFLSAQIKEISEAEYDSALAAAEKITSSTFPRIITYSHDASESDKLWIQTRHESAQKSYEEMKDTSDRGFLFARRVYIANETFEREGDGVWVRQEFRNASAAFAERVPTTIVFSSETIRVGRDVFIQLTKTQKWDSGKLRTATCRLDAKGRILESKRVDAFTSTTTYEYPVKVTPIKKPKLGSKEEI